MIYLFISVIIDMFLSIFISSGYQNISIFFPLVLVSSLPIAYFLIKNKKFFFAVIIIIGIIYDFLYSDIILINLYYFLLYSFFIHIFYINRKETVLNLIIISVLGFIFYDLFIFVTLILLDYSNFIITDFYYKMSRSLLVNISYVLISIMILKSRIFGYKNYLKKSLKKH